MSEKINNKTVGVIGLGDLGCKLAVQEALSGNQVLTFDTNTDAYSGTTQAVNPSIQVRIDLGQHIIRTSLKDILASSTIIHVAIASSQLENIPHIKNDSVAILHDSVMNNSKQALTKRTDANAFVVAHCLMNKQNRVLVSTEFGDHHAASEHLKSIGLDPRSTTVNEHDTLMARSQGVFALLLQLGLREELDAAHAQGNLTPSATELRSAVINREARWTKQTIDSILSNPKLLPFVTTMNELLKHP